MTDNNMLNALLNQDTKESQYSKRKAKQEQEETTTFNLCLPKELHKQIKIKAVTDVKSMNQTIIDLLQNNF